MLLRNLVSVGNAKRVDILVEKDRIIAIPAYGILSEDPLIQAINFEDAIVFPGLINSHDHLDFNLFPQLGNRKYMNYLEWGDDIHLQNKATIDKVLKVPKELSIQWGIYKNLLNGVTTVVNHGPKVKVTNDIISVWQDCNVLHSVQLEKKWKLKLNNPFVGSQPFAIHIGEGTDLKAHEEIDELLKWNLLKRSLIGIHAIAMDERQAKGFEAIVWCPDSNHFLIGQTAHIDKLKQQTNVVFGTDSTVSSNWNIWEHLRLARQQNMVTDKELFEMLTSTPAKVWPMQDKGTLEKNSFADIVIARKKGSSSPMDAFYNLNPEDILLVMHEGEIRLFDESLLKQMNELKGFSKVTIKGSCKYVFGGIPDLLSSIKEYYPEASFPINF
jgi:cytosine/adenosine deaminase-related metal-dependent hydrolase